MALSQAILNNSDATLSNGMRLDSGKIKFEDTIMIGKIDGSTGTADGELLIVSGVIIDYDNKFVYVADKYYMKKFNFNGTFISKFSMNSNLSNQCTTAHFDLANRLVYHYRYDKYLEIFDLDTGTQIIEINIRDDYASAYPYNAITVSPDGHILVTGNGIYLAYKYDITLQTLTFLGYTSGNGGSTTSGIYSELYDKFFLASQNGVAVVDKNTAIATRTQLGDFVNSEWYINTKYGAASRNWYQDASAIFLYNSELYILNIVLQRLHKISWNGTSLVNEGDKKFMLSFIRPEEKKFGVIFFVNGTSAYNNYCRIVDDYLIACSNTAYYPKISIINTLLTQQATWSHTVTANGTLKGFNLSGKQLNLCTWEYRINSGSWVTYTDDSFSPISVSISTGDTIELRAYGGDFEEAEKGGLSISDPYILINYETETPDTPVITSPIDGATVTIYDDEVTEIEVTCENTAQILKVYDDGVDTGVNEYHASGTTHTIPGVPCSAGEHIYTVKAMSTDGTKISSASDSVTIAAAKGSLSTVVMPLTAIISETRTTLTIS